MNDTLTYLQEKLSDERSGKVLFVSHCLLNENTRYPGGAFCSGIHADIFREIANKDYGIVQMPCPEQLVWGGVWKKWIWFPVGKQGRAINVLTKIFFPLFVWYTKLRYSLLAAKTASLIKDYHQSGFEIVGLVGIDGSPSCGVNKCLNMKKSMRYLSGLQMDVLTRDDFNNNLYRSALEKGTGIFMRALTRKLARSGIEVKMITLDLEEEMKGTKITLGI